MGEKRKTINTLKIAVEIVFAGSFAQLSFYQIVTYSRWVIIATMALSFFCGLFLYKRTGQANIEYGKAHLKCSLLLLIAAIVLIYSMYQVKGIPNKGVQFAFLGLRLFRLRYWLLAVPALFYMLIWFLRSGESFLGELWSKMDKIDRRAYIGLSCLLAALVVILYMVEPQWYLQYDKVYSIDSGWCYKNLFPKLTYYDIRHPILSIIAFPVWALVRSVLQLFVPSHLLNGLCVSCVQIINVQCLLLIGFMIKELSKNRWTFWIYLVSLPTITFTLLFEKYQICVLLLVLYAYLWYKKKNGSGLSLIFATGVMPTSILLFSHELLDKTSFRSKLGRILNIALSGIAVLICSGRIHLLVPQILLSETAAKAQKFGLKNLPIEECVASFINMVQGAFIALPSKSGSTYIWTDVIHHISFVGVAIIIFIIIGIISGYRDTFFRLCSIWLGAGFILIAAFQWGVHESPLFSVYFAWALIPLFGKGLQTVVEKLRWKETTVYPAVLTSMAVVNILAMMDIGKFLKLL